MFARCGVKHDDLEDDLPCEGGQTCWEYFCVVKVCYLKDNVWMHMDLSKEAIPDYVTVQRGEINLDDVEHSEVLAGIYDGYGKIEVFGRDIGYTDIDHQEFVECWVENGYGGCTKYAHPRKVPTVAWCLSCFVKMVKNEIHEEVRRNLLYPKSLKDMCCEAILADVRTRALAAAPPELQEILSVPRDYRSKHWVLRGKEKTPSDDEANEEMGAGEEAKEEKKTDEERKPEEEKEEKKNVAGEEKKTEEEKKSEEEEEEEDEDEEVIRERILIHTRTTEGLQRKAEGLPSELQEYLVKTPSRLLHRLWLRGCADVYAAHRHCDPDKEGEPLDEEGKPLKGMHEHYLTAEMQRQLEGATEMPVGGLFPHSALLLGGVLHAALTSLFEISRTPKGRFTPARVTKMIERWHKKNPVGKKKKKKRTAGKRKRTKEEKKAAKEGEEKKEEHETKDREAEAKEEEGQQEKPPATKKQRVDEEGSQ